MKQRIPIFLFVLIFINNIYAQKPETPTETKPNRTIVEDAVDAIGEEADFNFDTQFEDLAAYAKRPINLNQATILDLKAFGLLDPIQIQQLIDYRKMNGDLISIYELQSIESFDETTIETVLPYVSIGNELIGSDDLKTRFTKGESAIYTRFRRVLEEQKGYNKEIKNGYLGNRNQYYFRFRYNYDTRLSYGITLEKDAGEEFFTGSNPQGFDYMSAHFYIKDVSKNVKAVAIGDYQVSFGQGLILLSGFGFGKSAFVMNTKRQNIPLRAYTSVNENAFLRGAGTTLQFGDFDLTVFASLRDLDANIVNEPDSVDIDSEIQAVSAFQISGFHRTEGEILDKDALQQLLTGGSLKYNFNRGNIGLNTVFANYAAAISTDTTLQNLYRFNGKKLLNLSSDYEYTYRNIHFFGETALSDNLGLATLNSVLITTDKAVDFTVLHRHFDANFQSVAGNAFAESSSLQNETGLYLGMQIRPNRKWKLSAYFDTWQHQWLKFGIDAPSVGSEYLLQLNYRPNRETEMYVRFRQETKERNAQNNTTNIDFIVPETRTQLRFDLKTKLNDQFSIRSRVELSQFQNGENEAENGFLVYQDLSYTGDKFRFSTRFALFDTESFNTRIFAYENDLLYNFSVPAYYYKGSRFYFNARYRFSRAILLEARIARTTFYNRETVGSALEETPDNHRTEVKVQMRVKF